jgi:hypothetical protein
LPAIVEGRIGKRGGRGGCGRAEGREGEGRGSDEGAGSEVEEGRKGCCGSLGSVTISVESI